MPAPPTGRRLLPLIAAAVVALLLVAGGVWYFTRPDPLGSWETLPDVPTTVGIEGAGAALLDGKLYIIGGYTAGSQRQYLNTVSILDTATNTWSPGPPLQFGTSQMAVVVAAGRLHIFGGATERGATANTYVLQDGTWQETTQLPDARQGGAAVHDGTTIIFAGGVGTDHEAHDTIWRLADDGQSWKVAPTTLQRARTKLTAATDGAGTSWFIGGSGGGKTYADVDVLVEPNLERTTRTLPQPREGASAVRLEGHGLCVLGGNNGAKMFQWWCEKDGVARRLPKLADPRAGIAVATNGTTVYTVGGYNTERKSDGSTTTQRFTAHES
ncbi:Kelch repeat-containing protein [Dactylosporangium cerinum]